MYKQVYFWYFKQNTNIEQFIWISEILILCHIILTTNYKQNKIEKLLDSHF